MFYPLAGEDFMTIRNSIGSIISFIFHWKNKSGQNLRCSGMMDYNNIIVHNTGTYYVPVL
jgi:hypothetical protein